MKLTALIILAACLQINARGLAQDITLTEKKAPLEKVLKEIKRQSGYTVVYQDQLLLKSNPVDISVKNATVDQALSQIFEHQPMTYEIIGDKIIVIKEKVNSPPGQPAMTPPPPVDTVRGVVTNEKGEPMQGVTVVLKGTVNHTVTTDDNGRYSLRVTDKKAILLFSYVGYANASKPLGQGNEVNVSMTPMNSSLGQVVIVGYGSQKKVDVTGAISTVTSEDLTQAPVSDITNSLAGRLPGLIATQSSGEPGFDGAALSIRGFGAALIIVDGIETPLNNIDPNEITSISILKDASAAVYGARAGNGVILVTTKRGSLGKPVVRLNSTYSLQTLTLFPKPLNAGQYAELMREAELNSGTPPSAIRYSEDQVNKYKQGTEPGYQSTNWWDVIMNSYSPLQQHNLSVSGGSDNIKYFTFLGYTRQTGMYKSGDNKFQRYNVRSNIDGRVNKNLTISMDLSAAYGSVNSPTRDQANLWQDFYWLEPTYPAALPDPTKIAYGGYIESTVASVTRALGGYNDQNNNQQAATLSMKYNIPAVPGLYLKGLVNYLQNTTETKVWTKAYSMWSYDPTGSGYTEWPSAAATSLNESYVKSRTVTTQTSINYDHSFAPGHKVSGMALMEVSDYAGSSFSSGRTGYITTAIDQLFAGSGDGQTSNGSATQTGRISYVGRVNYAYRDKYLLESTVRYDGSPNFPDNKRWGLFPSVSAGWRINEEPIFKDHVTEIDNLKLRISMSNTGYDAIGAYQYITGYQFANNFIAQNEIRQGLISTGLANPDISWEKMTTYNAGVDISALQGKIYGSLDVFFRKRSNILASRVLSLPNTFGATLPLENINSQNNRGLELTIGHKGKIGGLSYDVSGNFSYARAKWVHYEEPAYTDPDDIKIHKVSGTWADRVFGYVADGLFTSASEIAGYKLNQDGQANATLLPGDIKYIDQNGDGKLDWRDLRPIGTGNTPQMMFGLNLSLQYGRFSLGALFQGAAGRDVMLNFAIENFSNQKNIVYKDRWTEENNNRNAIIPRQYMGDKVNNGYASSYWLKDAKYARLKTLNIGYDIPRSVLDRMGLGSVHVYFAGTNLFTLSGLLKYEIDPETPTGIKTGNSYPQQKIYTLGLNLSL